MADEPTPVPQAELPNFYLVRMHHEGQTHFIVCEKVVAFDQSKLFETAAKTLHQLFQGFVAVGGAEVAPLPPLGDPRWLEDLATMEVGDLGRNP